MLIKHIFFTFLGFLLIFFTGCQPSLSDAEKLKLNALDAAAVVQTYFGSGNRDVELYLSSTKLREDEAWPNFVEEEERIGGIDNLSVKESPAIDSINENVRRLFFVTYNSRNTSVIGEPPGSRIFFVYMIQEPEKKLWKVDSIGTGP